MNDSAFGKFVRARRIAAGLSLRDVADQLGVSHVYLGEVERGVRAPLKRDRWKDLIAVLHDVTMEDLELQLADTRPVQMNLSEAPLRVREFGLALARRIQERDIDDATADRLMRILSGGRIDE